MITGSSRPGVLALVLALGLLAGCTGTPSEPVPGTVSASGSPSPTPSPTPSTVAQENALASRVPLDGTDLRPLHWRLPAVKASDAPAVLAARRATAVDVLVYSLPSPAEWAGTQLAVLQVDTDTDLYQDVARTTSQPWEARPVGPLWVWIMNIHRESPDRVSIHQCRDFGWAGTVGDPMTKNWRLSGEVNHLVISRLSHYPDGSRWKVTDFDITGGKNADRYQKQCKAWAATHTTTEGWTLPAEPTTTPTP
jgi:hypothetical protein